MNAEQIRSSTERLLGLIDVLMAEAHAAETEGCTDLAQKLRAVAQEFRQENFRINRPIAPECARWATRREAALRWVEGGTR